MEFHPPAAVLTAVILMLICPTAVVTEVRLVNSDYQCSGTPEILYNGEWIRVHSENFDYNSAIVVCGELGCGDVVNFTFQRRNFENWDESETLVVTNCDGTEWAVSECLQTEVVNSDNISTVLFCSDSVRLVDGAGVCSGRVEVKSQKSWTTVCETDFDWQGAEVVCRELGCGTPLTLQGSLFGEGEHPFGNNTFQCKGTEKSLLTCSTSVRKEHTCAQGNDVGLTCAEPDEVRLVGGSSRCAGGVEMFYGGEWRRVKGNEWSLREAEMVCRQLDCGSAFEVLQGEPNPEDVEWGVTVFCKNSDSALKDCKIYFNHVPSFQAKVFCAESVRLVDGAGLCTGRVEVKSQKSWTRVCETDFDWQGAEVVCRELSCGTPLTIQGSLFGEGKHPFGNKKYLCKGTEGSLLTCSTSVSEEHTYICGNAVGLACSGPSDVRLVDGSSRCDGKVRMFYFGAWRTVEVNRWTFREFGVVCRQLDCGSAIAARPRTSGVDTCGSGVEVKCTGFEYALRECDPGYMRRIEICSGMICSESVRLVDGAGVCSGRVEVKSQKSWTTVCENDFDWQDAEVVCRELGCGNPLTLQGDLFGKGEHPFGDKEFQCKGTETSLLTCSISARKENSTTHGSAVGLTCSGPDNARLIDGNSRCAGIVEVLYLGKWRRLFSMIGTGVLCRQLNCGSAVATTRRHYERNETMKTVSIFCNGTESVLIECQMSIDSSDPKNEIGVVCSDFLEQPTISLSTPVRVSKDLQGSEVFRDQNFTITCSTRPQYPGGSFHLELPWNNRSHSQTAVNHSASFFFPAAEDSDQGNYKCVYENQVSFQTYTFTDLNEWIDRNLIQNFSSASEPLSLTVTDSSFPLVIIRTLLVPFLFLMSCLLIFLIFKKCGHIFIRKTSGQQGAAAAVQNENIELVSLQQNVERRSGEEQHTDLEQEEQPGN